MLVLIIFYLIFGFLEDFMVLYNIFVIVMIQLLLVNHFLRPENMSDQSSYCSNEKML